MAGLSVTNGDGNMLSAFDFILLVEPILDTFTPQNDDQVVIIRLFDQRMKIKIF